MQYSGKRPIGQVKKLEILSNKLVVDDEIIESPISRSFLSNGKMLNFTINNTEDIGCLKQSLDRILEEDMDSRVTTTITNKQKALNKHQVLLSLEYAKELGVVKYLSDIAGLVQAVDYNVDIADYFILEDRYENYSAHINKLRPIANKLFIVDISLIDTEMTVIQKLNALEEYRRNGVLSVNLQHSNEDVDSDIIEDAYEDQAEWIFNKLDGEYWTPSFMCFEDILGTAARIYNGRGLKLTGSYVNRFCKLPYQLNASMRLLMKLKHRMFAINILRMRDFSKIHSRPLLINNKPRVLMLGDRDLEFTGRMWEFENGQIKVLWDSKNAVWVLNSPQWTGINPIVSTPIGKYYWLNGNGPKEVVVE